MDRYVQVGDKWIKVFSDQEAAEVLELNKPEPPAPEPEPPKAWKMPAKKYRELIKDRRYGLLAGEQGEV